MAIKKSSYWLALLLFFWALPHTTFAGPVEDLAIEITYGMDDDRQKAKAIFKWVTHNIRYDVEYTNLPEMTRRFGSPKQQPHYVLVERKAVCEGHANLVVTMGNAVGLNIVRIEGVAQNLQPPYQQSNHAWNGIKLDGKWHLLDATWGAGYVHQGIFIKKNDPSYFLANPEWLIRSHWPFDPIWQLLTQPLHFSDFIGQRAPHTSYFSYSDSIRAWEELPVAERQISTWNRMWHWDQHNVDAKFQLGYYHSQLGMYKLAQYNTWKKEAQSWMSSLPDQVTVIQILDQAEYYFMEAIEHYSALIPHADSTYRNAARHNLANLQENREYFHRERTFLERYYQLPNHLRKKLDLHPQDISLEISEKDLPLDF